MQRTNKAAKRYESAHWGIPPEKASRLTIPGLRADEDVTEMGRLLELHVKPGKSAPIYTIQFAKSGGAKPCLLVFTPDTRERLFVYLPAAYRRIVTEQLVHGRGRWQSLSAVAKEAGGRQTRWPFPDTLVQVLGDCTHVVYDTEKEGDGPSEYIHAFGEESGVRPVLCVDAHGQLWLAGGNYSVPDAGITD